MREGHETREGGGHAQGEREPADEQVADRDGREPGDRPVQPRPVVAAHQIGEQDGRERHRDQADQARAEDAPQRREQQAVARKVVAAEPRVVPQGEPFAAEEPDPIDLGGEVRGLRRDDQPGRAEDARDTERQRAFVRGSRAHGEESAEHRDDEVRWSGPGTAADRVPLVRSASGLRPLRFELGGAARGSRAQARRRSRRSGRRAARGGSRCPRQARRRAGMRRLRTVLPPLLRIGVPHA